MRHLVVLLVACSSAPKTATTASAVPGQGFDELSGAVVQHLYQLEPWSAVSLGLHEFDGKLPDRSPAGLSRAIAQLQGDRAALEAIAGDSLTGAQHEDRDVLVLAVRERLFTFVDLDAFHANPMSYSDPINLDAYIIRDYAPVAQRAAAVAAMCTALPGYLAQARSNLKLPIPRTWIDTALLQTRGLVDFVDHDVREQLRQASISPALDTCKAVLTEHAAWLEKQQPQGTTLFALGEAKFLKMLTETQGVTTDLAHLHALADADLARNTAAIVEAAHKIDPKRSVREVVAAAADDKPAAAQVLEVATSQSEMLRAFIVAHRIVTIPSDDVAMVRPSPPFQRWNAAFLEGVGPFEQAKLPSYYYISPPDPAWPEAEQRAYIPARNDLLFTTVHEVYPGHFVHSLHLRKNPSRVLRSFRTYSTGEGWAHYAEEMMYDAGVGDHAPQARIGMLKEALLRNVRFVVALGEHTGKMSVEQATQLFSDKGFVDPGNARQQAVRGTFDPMFLSYTLGKLMIRKLHDDWKKVHPEATLGDFHDAFLSHACAPIPVIRAAMLGVDVGPVI